MSLPMILQGATGLAGIWSGLSRNRTADQMNKEALRYMQMRGNLFSQMSSLASNADVASEDARAINYAGQVAGSNLKNAMRQLRAEYGNAGGDASGDSAFRVQAQGQTNRIADPLRMYAAQQASTQTARKLDLLGSAMSGGGNLTDDYMRMANSYQSDLSPAVQLFAGAIDRGTTRSKSLTAKTSRSQSKTAKTNAGGA